MSKYQVGQDVEIRDNRDEWHKARIYNQSDYRHPESEYAVDVHGYENDLVFCGNDKLREPKGVE